MSRLRPSPADRHVLKVVPGPEWSWFPSLQRWLFTHEFAVDPRSNHVGIRLVGELPHFDVPPEMASRGVAIGALEVTPAKELVLLHRGRSITAGYPILAVVSSASLSRAGQLRPGDKGAPDRNIPRRGGYVVSTATQRPGRDRTGGTVERTRAG